MDFKVVLGLITEPYIARANVFIQLFPLLESAVKGQ